jgi:hypothetical protein
VLEKQAPREVADAHGGDHAPGLVPAGELERGVEQLRAELPSAVAGSHERPEEIGVVPAALHLDAAEAGHVPVELVDDERLLRREVPVGELALQLVSGRPYGVPDLLGRPVERPAGESQDRLAVLPAKTTQAAVHGAPAGRCARSRAQKAR